MDREQWKALKWCKRDGVREESTTDSVVSVFTLRDEVTEVKMEDTTGGKLHLELAYLHSTPTVRAWTAAQRELSLARLCGASWKPNTRRRTQRSCEISTRSASRPRTTQHQHPSQWRHQPLALHCLVESCSSSFSLPPFRPHHEQAPRLRRGNRRRSAPPRAVHPTHTRILSLSTHLHHPSLPLTTSELNLAGDAALLHPVRSTLEPSTVQLNPEESKAEADDYSPSPPLLDSDSDTDDLPDPSPPSTSDLLPLPPLPPPRSSSRQQPRDDPSPLPTSFRHRTNIYVDSADASSTEVFTTAFSPDSRLLAAGCADGTVRVYSVQGKLRWRFNPQVADALPVTCVRWRPATASAFSSLQNVLMATSADGTVSHYHLSSASTSKATSTLHSHLSNQLFTAAYNPTATTFATAGRDAAIRLYDEQTRQLMTTLAPLSAASPSSSGHSNRVYAVRWHGVQEGVLMSAGWDNTLLVWDVRVGRTVRTMYGPHVCGDALDVDGGAGGEGRRVVVGSWRQSGGVEVWDWTQGKLMEQVEYNRGSEPGGGGKAEMIYAAAWGGVKGEWMAAGGCGSNDAKVRRDGGGWEERVSLKGGVYSVAFSADGSKLAVAGADANMIVVDL